MPPPLKKFKNPTWRPAAILKTVKLPYINFDEIWHGDAYWPLTPHTYCWNCEFLKIRDGHSRHLENHKNLDISTTVLLIFTRFDIMIQNGVFNPSRPLKIWISKIQDGGWPPLWKQLNNHISATVWPILMKFGMVTDTGPLQPTNC